MWYLISFGGGFLIGIGFLIWLLVERSKRHTAETALAEAKVEVLEGGKRLGVARDAIAGLQDELSREKAHTIGLRTALEDALQRLVACDDPVAVRAWITDVLKGEKL